MSNGCETEAVLDHLLFHKSLIDEGDESRVDRYLRILEESQEGEALADPEDEYVRSVFDLVLNQGMDPWGIDLLQFSRMYAQRMEEGRIDLIVAGRLVHMAWSVLRLQSEEALLENERVDDLYFQEWDTEGICQLMDEPPEPLRLPSRPLRESVRATALRPVSLIELLEAFDEAREEMKVMKERERLREAARSKKPRDFHNNAHEEDMEKDVEDTWSRIQCIGAGPILLQDLFESDLQYNLSTFLAVLYLVRDGRLTIWQDDLPHGDVYLEMKMDWMSGTVEDSARTEIPGRTPVV